MEKKSVVVISTLDYLSSFLFLDGLKSLWLNEGLKVEYISPRELNISSIIKLKIARKSLEYLKLIGALKSFRDESTSIVIIGERTCLLTLLFTNVKFIYIHDEFFSATFKRIFSSRFSSRCSKIITFCDVRSTDFTFLKKAIDIQYYSNINPYLSVPEGLKKESVIIWNGSSKKYVQSGFKTLIENYGKLIATELNMSFLVRSKGTSVPPDLIGNEYVFWDSEYLDFDTMINRVAKCSIGLVMYYYKENRPNFDLIGKSSGQINMYLQLGIPVIVQRLSGLQWTENYNCVLQFDDINEIPKLIKEIASKYDSYSKNAFECYKKELTWR
jgi:hypothetical protein